MQKFDNSHHSTCDTVFIGSSHEYLDESDLFASHDELQLV